MKACRERRFPSGVPALLHFWSWLRTGTCPERVPNLDSSGERRRLRFRLPDQSLRTRCDRLRGKPRRAAIVRQFKLCIDVDVAAMTPTAA
jgi:hypothetical protein